MILMSFGFKYNDTPQGALVFDVRSLRNPHHIKGLRYLTGMDAAVYHHVRSSAFYESKREKVLKAIYAAKDKSSLVVAVGCHSGRHRSVAFIENLHQYFPSAEVIHRDINRRDQHESRNS